MIETILNELDPYILNKSNIENYLKYNKPISSLSDNKRNKLEKHKEKTDKRPTNRFVPREKDTLFWCYYIIINGDLPYETMNDKSPLSEKRIKIDWVSKIRNHKSVVKTYKFDTITNIESNLANDDYISIKTIFTLCAIENINLIFVKRYTYFELLMNDTNDIYIIRETENSTKYKKTYSYEIANKDTIQQIHTTLYKLESIDKPIKSLSSYKVKDLLDICNKLAIETTRNDNGKIKTKNELYESLIQYF